MAFKGIWKITKEIKDRVLFNLFKYLKRGSNVVSYAILKNSGNLH